MKTGSVFFFVVYLFMVLRRMYARSYTMHPYISPFIAFINSVHSAPYIHTITCLSAPLISVERFIWFHFKTFRPTPSLMFSLTPTFPNSINTGNTARNPYLLLSRRIEFVSFFLPCTSSFRFICHTWHHSSFLQLILHTRTYIHNKKKHFLHCTHGFQ